MRGKCKDCEYALIVKKKITSTQSGGYTEHPTEQVFCMLAGEWMKWEIMECSGYSKYVSTEDKK